MNLQESIRRILREDKKTKSTNKEFSKYKNSKFNTLRDYTLQDIVDNWDSLSDHKNENIKTIKYFINNPDKITDLVYDEKGLEDGYHRLIAAKILKKPRFSYRLVETLQESIRKILKEETSDETQVIKQILDLTILNDYRDYLCDIEVRHPKDRKVLQGQKEWTEYALVFTFLGGDGSKTMKYYDKCDKIMNEAWRVVYDYTNIATQVYSRHVVDCNDSY